MTFCLLPEEQGRNFENKGKAILPHISAIKCYESMKFLIFIAFSHTDSGVKNLTFLPTTTKPRQKYSLLALGQK